MFVTPILTRRDSTMEISVKQANLYISYAMLGSKQPFISFGVSLVIQIVFSVVIHYQSNIMCFFF